MTTLRGIAQLSNCLLTHMLLAYWRKLLAGDDEFSINSLLLKTNFAVMRRTSTSGSWVVNLTK
jgi:hypothetical protein